MRTQDNFLSSGDFILDSLASGTLRTTTLQMTANSVTMAMAPEPETNVITGTDASESIEGTDGADLINGLFGNDVLNGSAGADFYDGGPGSDTVSYLNSPEAVDVNLTRYVQIGGHAEGDTLRDIENLIGSQFNDMLGGDGLNNILNGGAGADTLMGNYGADIFVFSSAGEANGDIITDYSNVDALDFRAITNLKWVSTGNDGVNTYLKGDINSDNVADFTVTLNGVHTQINGVNVPFNLPAVTPPPPPLAPVITVGDATASESSGQMVFTLTRTGNLELASSVRYITSDGDARADYDYGWQMGEVTFAAGESTKTISIAILDDQVAEPNEVFEIDLLEGVNARLMNGFGIGTITDNDTIASPRVSVNDVTVSEKDGAMVFTVTRTGSLNVVSTVDFDVADQTAWQEEDYEALSGTLTFEIGESVKTIRLPVLADAVTEGAETMKVFIYEGKNVTVDKWEGTGTITDAVANAITGTTKNDTLYGTVNSDNMKGLAGNDIFYGSAGADLVDGGDGSDIISYFASKSGVDVSLSRAGQFGGDAEGDTLISIERLAGSKFNDVLTGSSAINSIDGNVGDDVINGKGGSDTLKGGAGNDTFVFDSALEAHGDFITDYDFGDRLDISAIDANVNLAGQQAFKDIGQGNFSKVAGELRITNDGVNTYVNADTNGDGKADFLIKVSGIHTRIAGISAEPTWNNIAGTSAKDTVNGTSATDKILTGDGNDVIYGSAGGDYIDGGAGSDAVSYTSSKAGISIDLQRAIQWGGDAQDDILFNVERIVGTAFTDLIYGNDQANSLNGNRGLDVIEGRGGADTLTGGEGNDFFVFRDVAHVQGDVITDWNKGDKLDFVGMDANTKVAGDQNFTFIGTNAFTGQAGQIRHSNDGVNSYVSGDVDGDGAADFTLTILGVHDFGPVTGWIDY